MSIATYLYNQTPQMLNNWKFPYKAFYSYIYNKKNVFSSQKPLFHHLKVYGYKAYILIKSKIDLKYFKKRCKLDIKAHIGFFVKYKLINIYRIKVLYKKKMVSVQDIIFNEDKI